MSTLSSPTDQSEVTAALRDARTWRSAGETVDVIETHGAMIFMCGPDVLKVKRAVRLPYLDFSTLQLRRKYLAHELELNSPGAPSLYRGLVAITREPDGRIVLDGRGPVVEWALSMSRFDQNDLMSNIVKRGALTKQLTLGLADAVVGSHERALQPARAEDRTGQIASNVLTTLQNSSSPAVQKAAADLAPVLRDADRRSQSVRVGRASDGFILHCHGDCIWEMSFCATARRSSLTLWNSTTT